LTIYDIAEKAGVSITTVSRVINGKTNVNKLTRERVLGVLSACGYTPSQLARGLASKASKTVGVLSVDIRDIHHSTIAYQVEQTLSTLGYSSIQCNFSGRRERLSSYLDMLISRQVDGIIFIGSVFAGGNCREQLEKRIDGSFPTVLINGDLPLPGSHAVIEAESDACGKVVNFLANTRKNIAFIGAE
jgi:DNA-binding LacI/PurR family transcriptional regulator